MVTPEDMIETDVTTDMTPYMFPQNAKEDAQLLIGT